MCCWVVATIRTCRPPDAVLCIVDASNLERNLYLVSQVLSIGLPTVVALNMIDIASDRGKRIDVDRLSERLGVPVVEVQANQELGLPELKHRCLLRSDRPHQQRLHRRFLPRFEHEVQALPIGRGRSRTAVAAISRRAFALGHKRLSAA